MDTIGKPAGYVPIPTSQPQKTECVQACKCCDCEKKNNSHAGVFLDFSNGVYMTYTPRDVKVAIIRTIMRFLMIIGIFIAYYMLFGVSDVLVLALTIGSCAGVCAGAGFLGPSCGAGLLACLLRGYTLGSEIAQVKIHWKI